MLYKSTRGQVEPVSFKEVLFSGLASDGGLYIPENFPVFDPGQISSFESMTYEEVSFSILRPFIGHLFSDQELMNMIVNAYSQFKCEERCKMFSLSENHKLLELFHGPTFAFKDFAMQMIAQMFNQALKKIRKSITIIVATSGDTGAAAVNAFSNLEFINLYVLFPKNRISEIQRRQMTTKKASNVSVISVNGDFDDCQSIVKSIFTDKDFSREISLTGVNSINWARIISQVVYYFFAASRLPSNAKLDFCVPTGNFGNIYAGYVAKKLGANIDKLIIATNQNDILHRALSSGQYSKGEVFKTFSPSMDIQVSSNFERMLHDACHGNSSIVHNKMRSLQSNGSYNIGSDTLRCLKKDFVSGTVKEQETLDEIRKTFLNTNTIVCPHTAVGLRVSKKFLDKAKVTISLATAHPAKFGDAVEKAIDADIILPNSLKALYSKEEKVVEAPNDVSYLKALIKREG